MSRDPVSALAFMESVYDKIYVIMDNHMDAFLKMGGVSNVQDGDLGCSGCLLELQVCLVGHRARKIGVGCITVHEIDPRITNFKQVV